MTYVTHDESEFVPPMEVEEPELYHPKTFIGKYIWSQDAKVIAVQYSLTAIFVGLVALVLSGIMRLQLGWPHTFSFITPSTYLQYVTMHGMIMVIYLLTALFLGGFGNYLIPLMVGARDMVFPYVNMVSYWVYLFAVLLLVASFFVPGGPTGAGWTLYPPQAILDGTPGASWGIVLMLVSLAFFIIGFTMGGLNYVVTVLQARTRGMTMMRLPLTVWGIFMATILALLAFPALFVSAIMMTLDHSLGTSFFMPALVAKGEQLGYNGGSPILFQHLFWFFGHPEVYIVALPAFGIVSDLISVNARKNIFGYRMMVWAILAIGGLSFIVWAHHMYVSGMNPYFGFFFATTTLIIAIPTALKVYNWVLTLWQRQHPLHRPDAVRDRLRLHVHQRRPHRPLPRQRAGRHPALRHDVRRRALPHGDGGVADPRRVRRDLPLVSEDHRADAQRHDGQVPLLGHVPRHLRDLLPDALPRLHGRAAPVLRDREHRCTCRRSVQTLNEAISIAALVVGAVQLVFLYNLFWSYRNGKPVGRKSVARDDARMADARHAAEARQLRPDAADRLPLGLRLQRAGRAGGLHSAEPASGKKAGPGAARRRACVPHKPALHTARRRYLS